MGSIGRGLFGPSHVIDAGAVVGVVPRSHRFFTAILDNISSRVEEDHVEIPRAAVREETGVTGNRIGRATENIDGWPAYSVSAVSSRGDANGWSPRVVDNEEVLAADAL